VAVELQADEGTADEEIEPGLPIFADDMVLRDDVVSQAGHDQSHP
jgi:hypothetical protein